VTEAATAEKDTSMEEGKEGGDDEEEDEEDGTIQTWTAAVEGHVAAKRLHAVTAAVDALLATVATAAGGGGGGAAEAEAAGAMAAPVALAAAAVRRVLADYVRLAKAQVRETALPVARC
jgi:hypothetical protein